MSRLDELIRKYCPKGVRFGKVGDLCIALKKGTLKTGELLKDGEFAVMNSGRDFYGYYDKFNNEGNAFTVAARGEYAGFINYMDEKFWAGGLCYPYRSMDENILMTKFAYYVLKSRQQHIMDTLVIRGGIPALNKSDLDNFKIPIPSLPVQQEIIKILDQFSELTTELVSKLTKEAELRKKQYEYYRNSLLSFDENIDRQTDRQTDRQRHSLKEQGG